MAKQTIQGFCTYKAKSESFEIIKINNEHPEFYKLLGPFFGSREVHKSLGGPIFDDDGKQWLVALTTERKVAGFCAFLINGTKAQLKSSFVVEEHRKKGIYNFLFKERLRILQLAGVKIVVGTATEMSRNTYEKYGFTLKPKGKYYDCKIELNGICASEQAEVESENKAKRVTFEEARMQAEEAKGLYKTGKISNLEAKEMSKEYIEQFNKKAEEIAKKYNRKPQTLNFNSFLRGNS